ncbi:MAG: hypothetical protein ACI8O8_000767 [Oleiphilaceae bacterium]|jgi:hypothetical protein
MVLGGKDATNLIMNRVIELASLVSKSVYHLFGLQTQTQNKNYKAQGLLLCVKRQVNLQIRKS